MNITYLYNTYNNHIEVPNAQSIVDDFEKSHVLTEGIYNIAIHTIEASNDEISQSYDDARNTNVIFRVNKSGDFQNIHLK